MYYILDGHNPVKVDVVEWSQWFSTADRTVARLTVDDISVLTVFLGLDHSLDSRPPGLFETVVFGGKHDGFMERYATWEEAEQGHKKIVEMVWSAALVDASKKVPVKKTRKLKIL